MTHRVGVPVCAIIQHINLADTQLCVVRDPRQHLPPDAPQVTRPRGHHANMAGCIVIHLHTAADAASMVKAGSCKQPAYVAPLSAKHNAYWPL
jgi:hypothetical protein